MRKISLIIIFFLSLGCDSKQSVLIPHTTYVKGKNFPVFTDKGVFFKIYVPEATLVTIAGTFNGWNEIATEMKKDDSGIWYIKLPLKKGKYSYNYVVDGYWIPDPDNPYLEYDGNEGVSSVIVVP